LFCFYGYPLNPNIKNLNAILKMLKQEHSFLREGESTSQQQVFRDLNKAFTRFFKGKSSYPKFKSKKHSKKSFRIQKNGNNIRITNRRIRLAKLGFVNYHTSKEYRKLLKSSKINNITIKKENGKYYAIINIITSVEELEHTGENIGIDLGLKNLATLSNGLEIANLDLKREDEMIRKYQKKLSRQKYMSKNYQKTLKKYHKWVDKKNNKINNAYHHLSKYIVKTFDLISMETLNIKEWFQNKKMVTKTTKNRIIQTNTYDKIQSRMVRKRLHTNRPILSINKKMPQLPTHTTRKHATRNTRMDMSKMWKTPPQRPKCSHKHKKRRNRNKIHTPKTKHNNHEPISQWEIAWINSYVPKKT
jgi:putative transposase